MKLLNFIKTRGLAILLTVLVMLTPTIIAWAGVESNTNDKVKPATTPITTQANGVQMMGSSIVSMPVGMYSAQEQASVLYPSGKAGWVKVDKKYQLLDSNGNPIINRTIIVSDLFGKSGIGNASTYSLSATGIIQVGFQWILCSDGMYHEYYFNPEEGPLLGACFRGGVVEGRTINGDGRVVESNGSVRASKNKPDWY